MHQEKTIVDTKTKDGKTSFHNLRKITEVEKKN